MKSVRTLLVVLLGLCLNDAAQAQSNPDADGTNPASASRAHLDIEISNISSDDGFVVIVLLDSAAQYDAEDEFLRGDKEVPIRDGKARVRFEAIPYGTYAVKIFHDENANGELDTNLVGFPKEGFGFSNDAMGRFGPPSFEQAAFPVADEIVRIEITTR